MVQALATYILALESAAASTRTAADRAVYQHYLAEAAVLLARAASGSGDAALAPRLSAHERTRGHTWLAGPERAGADRAWAAVAALASVAPAT